MARTCRICASPQREEIDSTIIAGLSLGKIAKQFGLSQAGIARHKTNHLLKAMSAALERRQQRDDEHADELLDELRSLNTKALDILDAAVKSKSPMIALSAIRESRATLVEVAKLTGKLQSGVNVQVNFFQTPAWQNLSRALLKAVENNAELRSIMIQVLGGSIVENGHALPVPMDAEFTPADEE